MNSIDNYQRLKANRDTKLDESGIGHNVQDLLHEDSKSIAEAVAGFTKAAWSQAIHNRMMNVPCGIMRHADCTSQSPIRHAIVSSASRLTNFDIGEALLLCADILDDVNAHAEADTVRKLAGNV